MFAREKRSQYHCYDRIDVGVGRDLGGIAVPQKVNVGGESDDGPNQNKINPSPN